MLTAAADILIMARQRIHANVKDLTDAQWLTQPDGFANNIAWNIGHLIIAQQGLVYGRLGLETYTSPEMAAMFRPGTSPADWTDPPDKDELLAMFLDLPQKMTADIAAGKFDFYVKPENSTSRFPPPESAAHALIFNQHHEGTHSGNISDLLAFIK
ncbi:MAG: DinB family protein [Chloroflexota bacterium]